MRKISDAKIVRNDELKHLWHSGEQAIVSQIITELSSAVILFSPVC